MPAFDVELGEGAGRIVAIPIRAYLRNSGIFKDVIEPGSSVKADQWVEIHVTELYGDFRKDVPAAAVLSLRFTLMDANGAGNGKPLFQKDYSQPCPIGSKTPDAVVSGWNQALTLIMKQVTVELKNINHGKVLPATPNSVTQKNPP